RSAGPEAHLRHHCRERATAGLLLAFGGTGRRGRLLAVMLLEVVGHLGLAFTFPAKAAARHLEGLGGGGAPAELQAERADHLGLAGVGDHREARAAGWAGEEHPERALRGLLDFLEVHVGFALHADELHGVVPPGYSRPSVYHKLLARIFL